MVRCHSDRAFVEAENVKGTIAALDFAITVIWTVPLVEDFDHLDPIHIQTKRPGYLNPMVLAGLDHDAHVSALRCSASVI
jgi:hypothetical protein